VKKCPECGNPSYDGAPVCGNCGYNFPKSKVASPIRRDIFLQEPKLEKKSDEEDTIKILKDNKLIIAGILIITFIVICGIILTSNNDDSNLSFNSNDLMTYSANGFTFSYPNTWTAVNESDVEHPGAVFYQNGNNVTVEFYNVTTESTTLKEITRDIITYAQNNGDYVELVETITLDGRNSSNIILENANGDYTRFVTMFSKGELYVFKISGSSLSSLTSDDINGTINSADIA